MTPIPAVIRLEVQTSTGWLDVIDRAAEIRVTRSPLGVGLLTAQILNASLDPATSTTLASGRPVRLTTLGPTGVWAPAWTGKLDHARTTYLQPDPDDVNPDPLALARIELKAVDLGQPLSAITEARSVHTTTNLRALLAATSLSWRVNGVAGGAPASPTIVANNPDAKIGDQVAIVRDNVRGFAWVDAAGVLQVYDPGNMPGALAATYTDVVGDGHPGYSEVEAGYDTADVVDEVQVTFLKYKPTAGATEQVTHTLRRPGTTGTNTRTFTITGPAMSDAQIKTYCETYALAVLDRHAKAVPRASSITVPARGAVERARAAAVDLCSLVRVVVGGRVDSNVRVDTIEHEISFNPDATDALVWATKYTFVTPEAVAQAQPLTALQAAPIQDRLATAEAVAAAGVDPAATAARLAGQVIEPAAVTASYGNLGPVGLTSGIRNPTDPATVEVVQRLASANRITIAGEVIALKQAWMEFISTRDKATVTMAPGLVEDISRIVGKQLGLTVLASGVRATSSVSASANTWQNCGSVSFPSGRFTAAPHVVLQNITAWGGANTTAPNLRPDSITKDGFTLQIKTGTDRTAQSVHWTAVQSYE